MALSVGPGELKTETVEEFISISDGQVSAAQEEPLNLIVACASYVTLCALPQALAYVCLGCNSHKRLAFLLLWQLA